MRINNKIKVSNKLNKWIICFSILFIISSGGIAVVSLPENLQWIQTIAIILAGASASLLASALIQINASKDQIELLQELSLDVDGFNELPKEFMELKWVAYVTAAPNGTKKLFEWRSRNITKRAERGKKMVVYDFPSKNLVGQDANYTCTFIGLKSCVLGVVSLGQEQTSVLIFDAPVPAAGIYFGPSYITDWFSERALNFAIVGTGDKKPIENGPNGWTSEMKEALLKWKSRVKINIELAFEELAKSDEDEHMGNNDNLNESK